MLAATSLMGRLLRVHGWARWTRDTGSASSISTLLVARRQSIRPFVGLGPSNFSKRKPTLTIMPPGKPPPHSRLAHRECAYTYSHSIDDLPARGDARRRFYNLSNNKPARISISAHLNISYVYDLPFSTSLQAEKAMLAGGSVGYHNHFKVESPSCHK